MRIDKFISESGIASRKDAARAARAGQVLVDGVAVKDLSKHIDPEKVRVSYAGRDITYRRFTYIMLNKPEGYVSATEDSRLPVVTELLSDELRAAGCPKVTVTDLARDDKAEAVEDAFRYGKLVLATTTYNADIFPFMREFVHELLERGYKNRVIGIIENGSWAPMAAKKIKSMFEGSKGITFTDTTVTIRSAMTEENKKELKALAEELCR